MTLYIAQKLPVFYLGDEKVNIGDRPSHGKWFDIFYINFKNAFLNLNIIFCIHLNHKYN